MAVFRENHLGLYAPGEEHSYAWERRFMRDGSGARGVIYVPGGGSNAVTNAIVYALVEAGFPQATVDQSVYEWGSPEIVERVKALIDFLRSTGDFPDRPVNLYGVSMGGVGALNFYRAYPDDVNAIALFEPVTNLEYEYEWDGAGTPYAVGDGRVFAGSIEDAFADELDFGIAESLNDPTFAVGAEGATPDAEWVPTDLTYWQRYDLPFVPTDIELPRSGTASAAFMQTPAGPTTENIAKTVAVTAGQTWTFKVRPFIAWLSTGDSYRLEALRPDGSTAATVSFSAPVNAWGYPLHLRVPINVTGNWKFRVRRFGAVGTSGLWITDLSLSPEEVDLSQIYADHSPWHNPAAYEGVAIRAWIPEDDVQADHVSAEQFIRAVPDGEWTHLPGDHQTASWPTSDGDLVGFFEEAA